MHTQDTSPEEDADLELEIAHVLLIDIVGYSRLIVDEQVNLLRRLNRIVRNTPTFQAAEANGTLTRLPTGDGMALIFADNPERPVRCAMEIAAAAAENAALEIRMGIHSGPINRITDVNDRVNVAGTGLNMAQRVMDCGDAGHILLSKHVADDLAQYRSWQPHLHSLGECEVKHGVRLHIYNLYKEGIGNPATPGKLQRGKRRRNIALRGNEPRPIVASPMAKFGGLLPISLSLVALAISLAVVFGRGWLRPKTTAITPNGDKSIAVLPFQNWGSDETNRHFAEGVQDEILTDLSKVTGLKVISRTSVMQYGVGAQRNLRDIATNLGVAYVVEGSVQTVEGRVRVNAQLIDARTDTHVWASHYDGQLADVFTLESAISEKIVAALKLKLTAQERAEIERSPTTDLAAYEMYSQARAILSTSSFVRGRASRLEAARLLESAVGRDPSFFEAHYQLASIYDQLYLLGMDRTPARVELAEKELANIKRLRPNSGQAHLASATHLYAVYLDYAHAKEELAQAATLLHNEAGVFELAAYIDRRQGEFDDAGDKLRHALELDPRNVYLLQQLALCLDKQRHFSEVAAVLDRALAILPDDPGLRWNRASVDLEWRADPEPLRKLFEAFKLDPGNPIAALAHDVLHFGLEVRDLRIADRALAAMEASGGAEENMNFPRSWYVGLVARTRGDLKGAHDAFVVAREEAEVNVRAQPNFAPPLCVLGMVDAALGDAPRAREEAGRVAATLVPTMNDHIAGATLLQHLAILYALLGDVDRSIENLDRATHMPSNVNFGNLKLHPYWESIRGDKRFDLILSSLAPG